MLDGNQLCAPIGSLTVKEPSQLPGAEQARTQPSSDRSVSTIGLGVAEVGDYDLELSSLGSRRPG